MKKNKVLNSHVSKAIATLGHFDILTINDAGMPIPNDERRIDLAITKDLPKFIEVLEVVLSEVEIQKIYLATEIRNQNPYQLEQIYALIGEHVDVEFIEHDEMKQNLNNSTTKANIRTGETTPFSNIALESNVTF